jgi:hypothetical protein
MERREEVVCALSELAIVFGATGHGYCLLAAKVEDWGGAGEAGDDGGHEGKANSGGSEHVEDV